MPSGTPLPRRRSVGFTSFTDEQVADLHHWLALLLADTIPRMAAMGHGYPGKLTHDEWQRVLTEMAAGFAAYAEATENGTEQDALPALNRSLDLLREWFPDLWD